MDLGLHPAGTELPPYIDSKLIQRHDVESTLINMKSMLSQRCVPAGMYLLIRTVSLSFRLYSVMLKCKKIINSYECFTNTVL